jgi:hypothetical protein
MDIPNKQRSFSDMFKEAVIELPNNIENIKPQISNKDFTVLPENPKTDLEKILVAIASLSRELDYLDLYKTMNTNILNTIKNVDKTEIKSLELPELSEPRCYKQNQQEHIFFESLRKDSNY